MLSHILKDSVVYGLSGGLGRAVSLLMAPILTRILLPSDYGLADGIFISVNLLVMLVALNADSAMVRYYYQSDDLRARYAVVNTSFWFQLLMSVCGVALLLPFAPQISTLLFKTAEHAGLVRLGLIATPFTLLHYHFQTVLQLQRRAHIYLTLTAVHLAVIVALTLGLVAALRWGVTGMVAAYLVSGAVTAGLHFAVLRSVYRWEYSFSRLKLLLSYSLPQFPGVILFWVNNFSGRFFLLYFISTAALGLYAIGGRVAQPVLLAIMAYQAAWTPHAMAAIGRPEAQQLYVRSFSAYLGLIAFLAGTIALFSQEVLRILATPPYYGAASIIGLLCLASALQGAGNHLALGISISQKTIYHSLARGAGTLAILSLNVMLIPLFGLHGAATATLLGELVMCALLYYWGQRLYPIPYGMPRAILGFLLVSAMAIAGVFPTHDLSILEAVAVKSLLLFGYGVLVLFAIFPSTERAQLVARLGQARSLVQGRVVFR